MTIFIVIQIFFNIFDYIYSRFSAKTIYRAVKGLSPGEWEAIINYFRGYYINIEVSEIIPNLQL
jgi:hypothetical protein